MQEEKVQRSELIVPEKETLIAMALKCSLLPRIREMQIRIFLEYYFSPIRLTRIYKTHKTVWWWWWWF